MKITIKLLVFFILSVLYEEYLIAQPDYTSETKLNQSSARRVSGDENKYSSFTAPSKIPQNLLDEYNRATDNYDDFNKLRLTREIERYLEKTNSKLIDPAEYLVTYEENPGGDWYNSDIQVHTGDVGANSFRTIDLKYAEDNRMYLAFLRRNISGINGSVRIYMSNNGGQSWPSYITWNYIPYYIQSMSMLVERRDNNNDDSTRIFIYFIGGTTTNFNDAKLYLFSCRRDGTGVISKEVASPPPGYRFTYVSACSDGMFYSSGTYMHIIVRQETNAGILPGILHFRSTDWGLTHTGAFFNTLFDERYPSAAFSNESGNDSIYIAVERPVAINEWEIRLISTSEIPSSSYQIRYITDAAPGTLYEKPAISIQQRHYTLPQQILVTSTKNDRAVYHASTNGGVSWNVDAALGLVNQSVDYTSCNSDSLTSGGGYFIAAYVDLDGDSVTVRRGILGAMGNVEHKRNSNPSTGVLSPTCAIYKEGSNKFSSFAYAGFGPTNIYYNNEKLITGIHPISGNIPSSYKLSQNYPNPFNPVTNIEFSLPKSLHIKLTIFDLQGREVETIVNQHLKAGIYKADWNAVKFASGVYFYKLEAEDFVETKKMILMK